MRGETDPWMFHQANLRDLGGGQSLITAFLDAVLAKYAARATFPIASPTMDELAQKTKARMWFDASGVSATIEPGGKLKSVVEPVGRQRRGMVPFAVKKTTRRFARGAGLAWAFR